MRQIKFRGKRIDNGEWVYGELFNSHKDHHSPSTNIATDEYHPLGYGSKIFIEVDPATVGQLRYTNSNGIEYYDGDIYYHAGYGEETVSDLCELQLSLIAGLSDDIGQIIGNIHDKK